MLRFKFCPTRTTPSIACYLCEKHIKRCFLSVDVFGGQTFVFSNFFSNMKAYVIVRGPVANIRNIGAMRSNQKLFAFTVANDLVRSDRLFW